jgi:ubiquinone/menaquinone biosynthesis C-methylase UbiE
MALLGLGNIREHKMPASGSYNVDYTHRDRNSEIQRLAIQAQLGWEKEARTLAWFGLSDGMSVLELGSGPGFITEKLLERLPHSPITCLEIDPSLIQQAETYLQGKSKDRVHFVEGSIMDTRLADNRFDFAYARLLFQHLPDPIGAAKEVRRMLKPDGKFVIYDVDDDMSTLFEPPFPEWSSIFEKFGQVQAAKGGNRRIGRHLFQILEAAGFQGLDLEATATR